MKKIISLLLLGTLVFSLCGCVKQENKTDDEQKKEEKTPTEEATEDGAGQFKGKTTEEYRMTSISSETKGTLTANEVFEDSGFTGVVVQGEDCVSSTLVYEKKADEKADGGSFFYAVQEVTDGDFSKEYSVTYKVTVPATRKYTFQTVSSVFGSNVSTDYVILVNGEEQASEDTMTDIQSAITTSVSRQTKLYPMTFEPVTLQAGENEIKFVLKNEDIEEQLNKKYFLYIDKLEILPLETTDIDSTIAYAADPTGEYAAQKKAAAGYSVFTNGDAVALRVDITTWTSANAGKYTFSIKDYYGTDVFAETLDVGFGRYTYNLAVAVHPVGYFELTVTDAAGEAVYTTPYVVMNDAQYRTIPDESPFAVDIAAADYGGDGHLVYDYACIAKLAGVPWVRERARWNYIEKNKGEYESWSTNLLRCGSEAGVKITTIINAQPRWITTDTYFISEQLAFYNMMKYVSNDLKDVIQAWEIYNEQDWHDFEKQSPDLYAAFMKVAALAIADSGSGALKILGSLCQTLEDSNHLNVYTANGLDAFIDVFNYHNHLYADVQRAVYNFSDADIAKEMSAYGNKLSVPTWVTEAGIMLYIKSGDITYAQEQIQARYMVQSTVQSLAIGTDKHFWFIYREGDPEGTGTFTSFHSDGTPRPSVAVEAVLTEVLGSGLYKGTVNNLPEKAEAHLFDNGTDDVAVLWSSKESEFTFHAEKNVLKIDMMGNKTVLDADENGNVTVTLTKEPVYIMFNGNAPTDFFTPSELDSVQTAVAKTSFTVGEHVVMTPVWSTPIDYARSTGQAVYSTPTTMSLQVFNFNDTAVSGTVTYTAPEGYTVTGDTWDVTVEPFTSETLTFTVTRTEAAEKGYLTFNGTFNGSASSPAASYVVPVK